MRNLAAATVLLLAGVSLDAVADERRARINYMLNCQGCHLPDGEGIEGRVPQLKDFVGLFLHSEDGRAFLINVSGVASSPLPDGELSELVNWMLVKFSKAELPVPFQPYSASEVSELRKHLELDPQARRAQILKDLRRTHPELPIPESAEEGAGSTEPGSAQHSVERRDQ